MTSDYLLLDRNEVSYKYSFYKIFITGFLWLHNFIIGKNWGVFEIHLVFLEGIYATSVYHICLYINNRVDVVYHEDAIYG